MSSSLIDLNDDLRRLHAKYRLEIRGAYLIVRGIWYLASAVGTPGQGTLVSGLDLDPSNHTKQPKDHTVWWTEKAGPYDSSGKDLQPDLLCQQWDTGRDLGEGVVVYQRWSRKPRKAGGGHRPYVDYHEKIQTYIEEISGQVDALYPDRYNAVKLD